MADSALPLWRECPADAVLDIRRIKARVDSDRLPLFPTRNPHQAWGRLVLAYIEWKPCRCSTALRSEISACTTLRRLASLTAAAEAALIPPKTRTLRRHG